MDQSTKQLNSSIISSGLTIYDPIHIGDPKLWITTPALESLLKDNLINVSIAGLPLRTRSKVVKALVCKALGYPTPTSFKKIRPRFPGQQLDIYIQKSNNLQVWNEELDPKRRYAIIRVSDSDLITNVKVVDGATLALLDTTGTLTQKYQATLKVRDVDAELISQLDTENISSLITNKTLKVLKNKPTELPDQNSLLPIKTIFQRLKPLVGKSFKYIGSDQERNRGAELHKLVCKALGYTSYLDDGRFPDVRNQLLEIKLQTSPTIDLGLVMPSSNEPLGVLDIEHTTIKHSDVRYAVFYGVLRSDKVVLTNFFLTTGADFFGRFPQFQGKIINKKLQIPLPKDFFS